MPKQSGLTRVLWLYRWQIGLFPLFVISIFFAVTSHIAEHRSAFISISVLYVMGDILMMQSVIGDTSRTRALSQASAMLIFGAVFFYTLFVYHEAEYALAQPFFWIAGWKCITEELWPRWYPRILRERVIGYFAAATLLFAFVLYFYKTAIPTPINLLQVIGLVAFGSALAVHSDGRPRNRNRWFLVGVVGLWLFTLSCAADVLYKYMTFGSVIATPLVAFFASLAVAIVVLRDVLKQPRLARP